METSVANPDPDTKESASFSTDPDPELSIILNLKFAKIKWIFFHALLLNVKFLRESKIGVSLIFLNVKSGIRIHIKPFSGAYEKSHTTTSTCGFYDIFIIGYRVTSDHLLFLRKTTLPSQYTVLLWNLLFEGEAFCAFEFAENSLK